ncbi:MAG: aspartate--tRNA ligase [Candidatus Magasanikbacteria bacterium]|jgi:aspartyl-tRNA synthetase|nr:aspartate--tRNA ligase [Candidatus Magasanikbacteria bacterium]MBT5262332.1 aspartate--tRNA ligase [Candidatus Magasanikbacteria bacterium]MBT5820405.1 aspartate--tRNA ligase [Candidatus Magasanikbacteria bacterium]
MFRTHTCGVLTKEESGKSVTLSGWVHKHRNFGGLVFLDLRDRYGITQIVCNPENITDFTVVESLKYEHIITVEGTVELRTEGTQNTTLSTGEVEVIATHVSILSNTKPLPFEIFDAKKGEEDEELRLKYRFLELRRKKLRDNILFRAKVETHIRQFMNSRDFIDIATPILTVSSPEGSRDYLVPSRIHPGKFYALPQAPQQYKQLLMVAGFDRYYQIAPCMRDEDPRADRAPGEFYQLDCETSFMTSEEFFTLMEPLWIELTEKVAGKKVQQNPLPRIPFRECMEKYGTDKPDLRFGMEIQEVTSWAKKGSFELFNTTEVVRVLVVPGGADFSRKDIDGKFTQAAKQGNAQGLPWMKVVDGTCESGIAKFFSHEQLQEIIQQVGAEDGSILFFGIGSWEKSATALGTVRSLAGDILELKDPNVVAWAWIVDFPMYEWDEENEKVDFGHNPFSMPKGGLEALNTKDPLDIIADQYDIIANGLELSSGAVRNKDPEIMYKAFEVAGYTKADVDEKFGHMIQAFEFGAPPHCGFAPGIERIIMVLTNEASIRNVVAFPKNQKAEEPMMGSPSEVTEEQLKELHLQIKKEKE